MTKRFLSLLADTVASNSSTAAPQDDQCVLSPDSKAKDGGSSIGDPKQAGPWNATCVFNHLIGTWLRANQETAAALKFAGGDYEFVFGGGTHNGNHGASIGPDAMRWLRRQAQGAASKVSNPQSL